MGHFCVWDIFANMGSERGGKYQQHLQTHTNQSHSDLWGYSNPLIPRLTNKSKKLKTCLNYHSKIAKNSIPKYHTEREYRKPSPNLALNQPTSIRSRWQFPPHRNDQSAWGNRTAKKNTDSRIDSAISHRSPSGCKCVRASKSIVPGEGGRGNEGFQWENETAGLRDDWSYYHNHHQHHQRTRPAPYQHFGLAGIVTEGWKWGRLCVNNDLCGHLLLHWVCVCVWLCNCRLWEFCCFLCFFLNVSVETFEIIYFTFVLVFLIVSFIRTLKFAKLWHC